MVACNTNNKSNVGASNTEKQQEKQLNISILLDLSDRINPQKFPTTPEHYQRDIENIKTITEFFKSNMQRLGAYKAKGKIKIFFNPPPANPTISSIASELNIDCSKTDNKGRKEIYDSITELFTKKLDEIYNQTIVSSVWEGSDIWRFFKDDVKDFCVDNDSSYRNILIIFTDGYLYHKQTVYNDKNQFSYILDKNLSSYRKLNWKQLIEQNNFGIMAERNDLENLEVLVLEVSAENPKNKIDEDIISFVWKNWFEKMSIPHYEVYRSDLPTNTKTRIENFLNQRQQ
ncbi:hypothetical protein D0T50_05680 [Bacteroides sp. 214]|nr:hypothetical protein [Bacteroides sp. 214]